MKFSPAWLFVILFAGVAGYFFYLNWDQKADIKAENDRLRADSTSIAGKLIQTQLEKASLTGQRERATSKALGDEGNRADRDNNTAQLVAAMTQTMQEVAALKGLISNNLLPASRYRDSTLSSVPKDSQYVAAVAAQGRILTETRAEVKQMGQALRGTQEQLSDLERVLNGKDAGISDLRGDVQDYVSERGLFRAKSKKQFRSVDRRLSEVQKIN